MRYHAGQWISCHAGMRGWFFQVEFLLFLGVSNHASFGAKGLAFAIQGSGLIQWKNMEKQWIITSGTVQLGNNVNWDVSIVFQGTLIYRKPLQQIAGFQHGQTHMDFLWPTAPWPSDSANGEVLDSLPGHWESWRLQWGYPSVINEKDIINEGFSMIFATFDDWRINPEIWHTKRTLFKKMGNPRNWSSGNAVLEVSLLESS